MIPVAVSLPLAGPRLQRPVLVSLLAHLAVAVVAFWWVSQVGPVGPPPVRRSYSVDLVEPPGLKQGKARQTAPVPKTDVVRPRARTGVKVDEAPSTEAASPKGVKKPARTAGQKGEDAGASAGAKGRAAGQGLRLEGEPFPYPEYIKNMVRTIDELWEKPLVSGRLKATVFYTLLKSGEIEDCEVKASSGVMVFDRRALEAVANASPLPPLPEGFTGAKLGVYLDFEY